MLSVVLFYGSIILSGLFGYLLCHIRHSKKVDRLVALKLDDRKKALTSYALGFHKGKLLSLLEQVEISNENISNEEIIADLQNKLWKATEEYDEGIKKGTLEAHHLLSVAWSAFMCLNFSKNNKIN